MTQSTIAEKFESMKVDFGNLAVGPTPTSVAAAKTFQEQNAATVVSLAPPKTDKRKSSTTDGIEAIRRRYGDLHGNDGKFNHPYGLLKDGKTEKMEATAVQIRRVEFIYTILASGSQATTGPDGRMFFHGTEHFDKAMKDWNCLTPLVMSLCFSRSQHRGGTIESMDDEVTNDTTFQNFALSLITACFLTKEHRLSRCLNTERYWNQLVGRGRFGRCMKPYRDSVKRLERVVFGQSTPPRKYGNCFEINEELKRLGPRIVTEHAEMMADLYDARLLSTAVIEELRGGVRDACAKEGDEG
jgi:hypothetical protein